MIIDSDLRCRWMARYRVPLDRPSPIELIGWEVALRDRQGPVSENGCVKDVPAHGRRVGHLEITNCDLKIRSRWPRLRSSPGRGCARQSAVTGSQSEPHFPRA